jgi:hypothetical protein
MTKDLLVLDLPTEQAFIPLSTRVGSPVWEVLFAELGPIETRAPGMDQDLVIGLRPIWKFTVDAGGGRAGARLMHSHNSLTFLLCLRLPLFRLHTRIRMARCGSHIPILLGTRQAFETIFLVVAIFYLVVAWRNDEGCRRFWCCLWKSAAASYE